MLNLFTGLKIFIVSVLASVSAIVSTAAPMLTQNTTPVNPVALPRVVSSSASPASISTTTPTANSSHNQAPSKESPLPLNGENYIYVQGTYSYLGQDIKYLFLVPKKGGDFSGVVQGACQAQAGGNYEGGDGGKISGSVGGACNMFGIKVQGSTKFSGRLYPNTKTVELDIDNSPIHSLTIKYN